MIKHIIFIALVVGGTFYYWTTRPVTHGPGVVAPSEPVQREAFGVKPIKFDEYTINALAEIELEARVLSKKRYYYDKYADVAPYDFVFGWGAMSDEKNLNPILVKQSDRNFYWEMIEPPISEHLMRRNSANMHLIPSSDKIADQLGDVREGHVVKLEGYLVKVSSEEGWVLKSSLTRRDVGDKASEVVWITDFSIR